MHASDQSFPWKYEHGVEFSCTIEPPTDVLVDSDALICVLYGVCM